MFKKISRSSPLLGIETAMPARYFSPLFHVVQHLSDFCRKIIAAERFLNEIYSFVQNAPMGYHVGGIARHIQALEVRPEGAKLFCQFSAVHLRHHHVRDQQVKISRMLLGKMDGVYWSMRRKHRVTQVFENHLAEVQDRFIVLDQQDGFRACRALAGHLPRGDLCGFSLEPRQVDFKRGPFPRFAGNINKTVVLFDDAVNGGQSQPGSLAQFLGGKKRLEDILAHFLAHTFAVVAHGQQDVFSGNKFGGSALLESSITTFSVLRVMAPTPEMASRALTTRLARIWSTWEGSILTFQRSSSGIHNRSISSWNARKHAIDERHGHNHSQFIEQTDDQVFKNSEQKHQRKY